MANILKPMVFIPNSDCMEKADIFTMYFPYKWAQELLQLYDRIKMRQDKVNRLPTSSLNSTMIALFPEIIKAEFRKNQPWITSNREIDNNIILNVLKSWIKAEFLEVCNDSNIKDDISSAVSNLNANMLTWKKVEVQISQKGKKKNGTIDPEQGYFNAIPEYICNKLCSSISGFKLNGETLYFNRCGEAEMMSWPPSTYKDYKNDIWYFSIVMKFNVQTIPFYDKPIILMDISTRRFVSNNLISEKGYIKLSNDNKTSVYLSTKTYWFDENQKRGFSKAMLKCGYVGNQYGVLWDDKISGIMKNLSLKNEFPEPMELIQAPENFIDYRRDVTAAILYNNPPYGKHEVGTGVSMRDMNELYQQVLKLIPEFKTFETNDRIKLKLVSSELAKAKKIDKSHLRGALSSIVDGNLNIELRCDNKQLSDEVKNKIFEIFGLEESMKENGIYSTPELNINIINSQIGTIGNEIGEGGLLDRVKEIQAKLPKAMAPTGVIAEIEGRGSIKWANGDPKGAIRDGFGKTGRLTQFITPQGNNKDNYEKRAENAVWDLLRQFGYMPYPLNVEIRKGNIKNEFGIFGFWIIRTNKNDNLKGINFPVVVYMRTDCCEVKVNCPLFNKWLPYYKAQLELCKYTNSGNMSFKMDDENIKHYIRKTLTEIGQAGPSLVLLDSQNIRSIWKWIQDGRVDNKKLWVLDENDELNLNNYKDMRIVRVRSGEEVPSYYGDNKKDGVGTVRGLFEVSNNVFWGTGSKPNTLTGKSFGGPNSSRLEEPGKEFKYCEIGEIVPLLLQQNDIPSEWVYAVYKMREMLSYYDEFAKLPAPLHLAEKLEEYINEVVK